MSCNGCRVLRKGCSESCLLRPCLAAVEGADAQGHATLFLAKFFGRAGLMGFISAVDETQRPALFQSLLYEACGRSINPVYGSAGLLWTGQWHLCEAAVESVLKGGTPTSCFTNVHTPAATTMAAPSASLRQCNTGFMPTPTGLPPQSQISASMGGRAHPVSNPQMSSFPFQMMDPSSLSYWPTIPMGSMPNSMSHIAPMMGPGAYQSMYQPSSCPVPVPGPNYLSTSNRMPCVPNNGGGGSTSAGSQMWMHDAAMAQAIARPASSGYHSKVYRHEMANSNSPVSDVSCVVDTLSGMHCSSPPLVTPVARRLTVQSDKAGDSSSVGLGSPSFVSSSNGFNRPYGHDGGLTWQSA